MTESLVPITLNFSGTALNTFSKPMSRFPLPILTKASIGMAVPPINKPYPLTVSEIATAFKPPKTA